MKKYYVKRNSAVFKTGLILLITCISIIYGCRKDISKIVDTPIVTPGNPKVAAAKQWYGINFPKKAKVKQTTNAVSSEFDLSQFFNPDWDAAKTYNRFDNDVIEMPIDSATKFGLNIGQAQATTNNSRSSVLIIKSGDNYEAYIMTLVGSEDYLNGDPAKLIKNAYNKRDPNFSGLVYYTTPNGKFVNGYTYLNGSIKGQLLNDILPNKQTVQSIKPNLVQYEVCTYWWQLVPDDSGGGYHKVWFTEPTNCHMVVEGDLPGGIPPSSSGPGSGNGPGSGGPGGTTPSSPTPCTPPNVDITALRINGVKVNLVQPPDGGFPPPKTPNPCPPVSVIEKHPIFGINNSNAVIPDANYNLMLNYLKGLGYKVYDQYPDFVTVDGVLYPGVVTPIISADGKDIQLYFKPNADGGTMTTTFNYSMGNKGPQGSNPQSNWPVSMPSYFGDGIVTYSPPPFGSGYTGPGALTSPPTPADYAIYPPEWFTNEDELGAIGNELQQQGLKNTDPIPEAYYKNGTPIDMTPSPIDSRTVKGAPRNAKYFWTQLIKKRPEMFSEDNRKFIATNEFKKIKVDEQWIKYNPTHKAYFLDQLVHHHEEQGPIAYAIPVKVHVKWTRILHEFRASGKIPRIKPTLNSFINVMQVFSFLTDIQTGNPDAWVNWFGQNNQVGKIYKQPLTGDYYMITKLTPSKNSSGIVIRAVVTYDVYADYIWDTDEGKYMGVQKLATFTEDINVVTKKSTSSSFQTY
jgi:hypothetical protein